MRHAAGFHIFAVWFVCVCVAPAAAQDLGPERSEAPLQRPPILMPLYAGTIALQAYDAYSTLTGVRAGYVEGNPLMNPLVTKPAAMIAVKSTTTFVTIFMAERLWKSGHRGGAILTVALGNVMVAAVAYNNARRLAAGR